MEADSQAMECEVALKSGETVFFSCSDQSTVEQNFLQNSSSSGCAVAVMDLTNSVQQFQEQRNSATRQYCSIGTQTDTPESACSVQTEHDTTENYSSTGTETDLNAIGDRKTLQTLLKWALSICSSEDNAPLIIPRFQEEELQSRSIGAHSSLLNLEHRQVHRRDNIQNKSRKDVSTNESNGARMTAGVTTNRNVLRVSLRDTKAGQQLQQPCDTMSGIEHPINSTDELLGTSIGKDVLVQNSGVEQDYYQQNNFIPRPFFQSQKSEDTKMESPDAQNNQRSASINIPSQTETNSSNATRVTISYDVISGDIVTVMDSVDTETSFEPLSDCPETGQTAIEGQGCYDDDNDDGGVDVDGGIDDGGGGDVGDGVSGLQSNSIFNASLPAAMPYQQIGSSAETATSDYPAGSFKCSLCPKRYRRHEYLKIHYNSHTGKKPYHCTKCQEQFSLRSSLKYHVNHTHKETAPHECHLCKKRFTHEDFLKRHLETHAQGKTQTSGHAARAIGSYKCDKCDKAFQREEKLSRHMGTHNRTHKCQFCAKSFGFKSMLDIHARVHSGERPYQCTVCSKRFRRRDTLVGHSLGHTGEKPYKCRGCGKAFGSRTGRSHHFRSTHLEEKVEPRLTDTPV